MLHQPGKTMFVFSKKQVFLEKKHGRPLQSPLVCYSIL